MRFFQHARPATWVAGSDDQAWLMDWCIRNEADFTTGVKHLGLNKVEHMNSPQPTISVPSLSLKDAKPFDAELHRLVKQLKEEGK